MLQYIVWTHRYGTDVIFFKSRKPIENDIEAWAVLLLTGCDIEPDRNDEYVETYGIVDKIIKDVPSVKIYEITKVKRKLKERFKDTHPFGVER